MRGENFEWNRFGIRILGEQTQTNGEKENSCLSFGVTIAVHC